MEIEITCNVIIRSHCSFKQTCNLLHTCIAGFLDCWAKIGLVDTELLTLKHSHLTVQHHRD